jgi:hypothetical protein
MNLLAADALSGVSALSPKHAPHTQAMAAQAANAIYKAKIADSVILTGSLVLVVLDDG